MKRGLPEYRGRLIGTAWSRIRLTEALMAELKKGAHDKCPVCKGRGFFTQVLDSSDPLEAHPCHCINRPPASDQLRA